MRPLSRPSWIAAANQRVFMALGDDIRALRDRVLADLNAAHDYFADTRFAWNVVKDTVQAGAVFTHHNQVTGTVTAQADLVARAKAYIDIQLAEASFQQFIAIFETFFLDLLRLWLLAFPQSLGGKQVTLKDVL